MFQIDERIDYARIQQFATQVSALSAGERELFDAHFSGGESTDFNLGLLAGLAGAHVLASDASLTAEQKAQNLGKLVAFVADKIARRGF